MLRFMPPKTRPVTSLGYSRPMSLRQALARTSQTRMRTGRLTPSYGSRAKVALSMIATSTSDGELASELAAPISM